MMRRVVAALLRLYPARFRRRMGDDLLATFDRQWNDGPCFALGARTVANLTANAAVEHWNHKGDGFMATIFQDLRFALRLLRRSPAFTTLVVAVLALGIGANSAIFSLLDAALFKPMPFANAGRLVMLWERSPEVAHHRISPANFEDWEEQNSTFDAMASISGGSRTYLGPTGIAERVPGLAVSVRFFDVLGMRPLLGRTFSAVDNRPHAGAVVLSERFWRNRLRSDPHVIGRSLVLDSEPATVIGVVPGDFQFLDEAEFWTPFYVPKDAGWRGGHFMQAVGRLKPGVTLAQAHADMAVVAANTARVLPSTNKGWGVTIELLRQALVAPELRTTSIMLAGVAGFVLLMACANVANLMLVRGAARTREIAVRASIGGSRGRIARQLLTESALIGLLGGAAGFGVAALILHAAPALLPPSLLPAWLKLSMDSRVAAFAAASTLLTALLFGLAPAWHAARVPLAAVLRSGMRTATGGGFFRALLAAGEIAAAVLLVSGAGLLLRTLASLEHTDSGVHADRVLTMYVSLPNSRYPSPSAAAVFYRSAEREIAAVPGVERVGMSTILPADGWDIGQGFHVVGTPKPDAGHSPSAHYQLVSADYFRTLGIPLVRGRGFDSGDSTASTPVCIVNQEFARRYLRDRDPIGASIEVPAMGQTGPIPVTRQVVGVSRQVVVEGLAEKERDPEIYVPQAQNAWFWSAIAVKTAGDPLTFVKAVQAALARVDRQEAVTRIRTMDQVLADTVSGPRFRAGLTASFALVALALAAVGIFGVLAFSVSRRTREFGIRMALGAQPTGVLRMVLREALIIASGGIAAGLIAAGLLTRSLKSLLVGVKPLDAATFAAAAALLVVVALAACALPAWRAARVDPAVALRQE